MEKEENEKQMRYCECMRKLIKLETKWNLIEIQKWSMTSWTTTSITAITSSATTTTTTTAACLRQHFLCLILNCFCLHCPVYVNLYMYVYWHLNKKKHNN